MMRRMPRGARRSTAARERRRARSAPTAYHASRTATVLPWLIRASSLAHFWLQTSVSARNARNDGQGSRRPAPGAVDAQAHGDESTLRARYIHVREVQSIAGDRVPSIRPPVQRLAGPRRDVVGLG